PLFPYFVGQTQIDSATWRAYERVNERFAEVAADASDDEALVWVHDYQLLRVPHHLRRLAPRRRIAFFLHIPFPAADVLRVLPWSRDLIQGMLASDLVGVHIRSYADHVLTCAERLLGCEVDRGAGLVRFEGREVSVEVHPISIDVAEIERLAARAAPGGDATVAEILGVDRLDYTEGIHEGLLVNPFDVEEVADALHRALQMPLDERRARMSALRHRVRANDVRVWVERFLDASERAGLRARNTVASAADAVQRMLAPWLARRSTVALFLDYDGRLTPIVRSPG